MYQNTSTHHLLQNESLLFRKQSEEFSIWGEMFQTSCRAVAIVLFVNCLSLGKCLFHAETTPGWGHQGSPSVTDPTQDQLLLYYIKYLLHRRALLVTTLRVTSVKHCIARAEEILVLFAWPIGCQRDGVWGVCLFAQSDVRWTRGVKNVKVVKAL